MATVVAQNGLCTWILRTTSGAYVYDPATSQAVGYSRDDAYAWLSTSPERVVEAARGWMGGAIAVRGRP